MSAGFGPPILDFSPLAKLGDTFFNARDKAIERSLKQAQLSAGDEIAKAYASSLSGAPSATVQPTHPLAPLGQPQASRYNPQGKAPTFAGQPTQAASILQKFEGYRDTPYWDVNAYRIGYGSDTITDPNTGQVRKVTPDDRIDRSYADADLARRIPEFQRTAVQQTPAFANLPGHVQAALTSVAYNYGSLPKSVVAAVNSGDLNQIASAVEALPANPDRRRQEAAIIRGGSSADLPAQGAQNAQGFVVPGQSAGQSAAPAAPRLPIPPYVQTLLQSNNPYARAKGVELMQQYQAQQQKLQQEMGLEVFKHGLDQGNKDRTYNLDRDKFDYEKNKPVSVAPNNSLVRPNSGEVTYTAPAAPTGDMTEYNLYVKQAQAAGRAPEDFTTWSRANKASGATTINNVQKAEGAYDQTVAKDYGETFVGLQKGARAAIGTKNSLALMDRLTRDPNFYSGFGGEGKLKFNQLLTSLGVKDANAVAPSEAFGSLMNDVILGKLGGSLGTGVSNGDVSFMQGTGPTLTKTKEGNQLLIQFGMRFADRSQQVAKMARDYAKAHGGRIDAGFDDELAQWAQANPLFTEKDFQAAQDAAKGIPVSDAPPPVRERPLPQRKDRVALPPGYSRQKFVQDARAAVMSGKSRAAVEEELWKRGIDPRWLDAPEGQGN